MAFHTITAPGAEHVSVPVQSGQTLAFTFDTSTASYERTEDNLTINFDNGGKVILDGFFQVEEGSGLPTLKLEDGTEISAKDFLAAMNPDMDLATAAGPGASPSSSGAGDYADSAGNLIGGIDRLGSLGTDQWSGGQDASDFTLATGDEVVAAAEEPFRPAPIGPNPDGGGGMPGTEGGGQTPETPELPEIPGGTDPYHTRLIVTDTAANTFSFFAVDKNGNLVDDANKISYAFDGGASRYFTVLGIDPATGRITVELTQAGLDALAAGERVGDMLLISVDGEEYRMPLVINDDQSYDHVSEEAQANLGPDLKAEWYASDSSTVSRENITLGGSSYNRVDISKTDHATSLAATNSHIDITAASKGDVLVSVTSDNLSYGVATYGSSGERSSSIKGGAESTIVISATSTGSGRAFGVFTSTYDGIDKADTFIEGNDIRIEAHGNTGGAMGIYSWRGDAVTTVHAASQLTIAADSQSAQKDESGVVRAVHAYETGAINLSVDAGGKLVVTANLGSSQQTTYDMAQAGMFAVSGVSALSGGQVNIQASDIHIKAAIGDSSDHGTAVGVYSGWTGQGQISKVTIKGYEDVDNTMAFSAKAREIANGILATNSGNVYVTGGNRNDLITVNAEAERGSAIGLFAQAHDWAGGSKLVLDGGAGNDTLNINTRFTGTPNNGNLELTNAPRGAIGIIAAWQQGWGDDEDGAAQVRINNVETINVLADARGSGGSAIGIFTQSMYQSSPGVYINSNGKALALTITALAEDASKTHSLCNHGGTIVIQGGSSTGTSDTINMTGHMTANGPGSNSYITTGSGNDFVSLTGDMNAARGNNNINTGEGNDTMTITGSMRAGDGTFTGTNILHAGNGDNTVSIGWSMISQGAGSENSITSGSGTDSISITGQVYASDGGKNVIDTGLNDPGKAHDTLSVNDSDVWQSRCLDAVNSGENILKASGSVIITSESYHDALGMYAGGKYDNASDQASNTVSAKGDITVNTTNSTGSETSVAYSVYAENGKNTLSSQEGNIHINSRGTGDVRGVLSHDGGLNTLEALGGLMDISATDGEFGRGVDAWGSDNKVTANNVKITSAMSKDSVGVAASYGGENTIDSATNIAVTSTVTSDEAGSNNSGLWALDGGKNVLTAAGNVNITAEYGTTVTGVRAEGGINDIAGKVVTITANGSNTDTTCGMFASQGGENNVHALDGHGIQVTITAKAGAMDEAIALLADGAKNIISGDLSGNYADNVTINGGIQAVNEGTNLIRTGGGNDRVTINGTIGASDNTQPGTGNIIDTGDGDDVIRLHGDILSDDALSLNAGDGYDTLVLVADDFAQFQQFYSTWLTSNFSSMNVEAVHVDLNGVSDADWVNFQSYFNSFPNDVSVTYTVDGTLYADGYLNAQGDSVLDLGSILDTLDDNEIKELDLTGGKGNALHIGKEALDSLAEQELLIRGDGNDSVTLFGSEADWQTSTWDQDNNYTCYTNDDGQQIILQNTITVLGFGG